MTDSGTEPTTRKLGFGMLIAGWLLFMLLAAMYFENSLQRLFNPNQQPEIRQLAQQVEVELRPNRNNHYVVTATINQQPVVLMLDTGATVVALPEAVAERLGLRKGDSYWTQTANGRSRAYSTRIDQLAIGPIQLRDIDASISPGLQGDMGLLGMSALKQLSFRQEGELLILQQ